MAEPSAPSGASDGGARPGTVRARRGIAPIELRFVHDGLSDKGDARHLSAACGRCGTRLASRVEACANSVCGARLRWDARKRLKCRFCRPKDKLTVADLHEIPENDRHGFCAFCGGSGKRPGRSAGAERLPFGLSRSPAGGRSAACPICRGSAKCMRCMGSGWIDMPDTFGE
ncbi:MAG: hypothetical protein ACYTKD_16875 [Planctomycetota bacterium]